MPYENLDIELSDATMDEIEVHLHNLKTSLDFLINLTPKERKDRAAFSRQKLSFGQIALEIATSETQTVPPAINLLAWQRDLDAFQKLTRIKQAVAQIHEGLNDTTLALKTETSRTASIYYGTIKILAKTNLPGADAMVGRLQKALGNPRKKKLEGGISDKHE
jgi:hypothetical protein